MALRKRQRDDDPRRDYDGLLLTPSLGGKDCKGNGSHKGIEIRCDECNYFLECFPEYESPRNSPQ